MIPGMISKIVEGPAIASAAVVTPRGGELFRVTGTTQINTINPPLGIGQNQVIYLLPTTGSVILGTTGNIAAGLTLVINRLVRLVWLRSMGKWYIENGA